MIRTGNYVNSKVEIVVILDTVLKRHPARNLIRTNAFSCFDVAKKLYENEVKVTSSAPAFIKGWIWSYEIVDCELIANDSLIYVDLPRTEKNKKAKEDKPYKFIKIDHSKCRFQVLIVLLKQF